jgi:hypothetical protein
MVLAIEEIPVGRSPSVKSLSLARMMKFIHSMGNQMRRIHTLLLWWRSNQ